MNFIYKTLPKIPKAESNQIRTRHRLDKLLLDFPSFIGQFQDNDLIDLRCSVDL
jgi:hypothetical protein